MPDIEAQVREALMSYETEKATEKIARRMAREAGQPEGLWEMFLMSAYEEHFKLDAAADREAPDA